MSVNLIKPAQAIKLKGAQIKPSPKKFVSSNFPKWAIGAVLIFTVLLYIRSLANGFVSTFDDYFYIHFNPFIKDCSIRGIINIFTTFYFGIYHPLTTLTYLFEYTLFKLNPMPYHIVNLLLHLLNTWLVYKLIERLSGKQLTALIVSLLFAIHPMHVETVAWIADLKDLLYSSFYILSLIIYLRYFTEGYKAKYYIGTLLLFIASLLAKPSAVTLPLIMIGIDIYKERKINLKVLIEKAPFFLLSVIIGIITIVSFKEHAYSVQHNAVEKLFMFFYNIAFYVIKVIAPFWLSALHYCPDTHGAPLPWEYYASLPLIAILAVLCFRRTLLRKEILLGVYFFLVTISVTLLEMSGPYLSVERYTYLPYIGIFYIAGQWMTGIAKPQMKSTVLALFALVVVLFSVLTWERIPVWKEGEGLFTDVIKKNPDYYHCYMIRASARERKGNKQGALEDWNKTILLKPGFAEAYNNRGCLYDGMGDAKAAMNDYNMAISFNPLFASAYNNRGVLKANTGDFSGALKDLDKIIAMDSGKANTYSNRGNIKAMQKDYTGAIEDFTYALKLQPNNQNAYYNRAISRLHITDTLGACEDWGKAAEMGDEGSKQKVRQYCMGRK